MLAQPSKTLNNFETHIIENALHQCLSTFKINQSPKIFNSNFILITGMPIQVKKKK